jgi:hypothetical protein
VPQKFLPQPFDIRKFADVILIDLLPEFSNLALNIRAHFPVVEPDQTVGIHFDDIFSE